MAGKPKKMEKVKSRVSEARGELMLFDPDAVVTDDDPRHPHHNPERSARRTPDKDFVANVAARGVIEPIIYKRVDGVTFVIDGNRRIRAARIVNADRRTEGADTLRVKGVGYSGADVSGTAMSTNYARQDEADCDTAEWIRRYTEDEGHTLAEAAAALGWAVSRAKSVMRVRDAVPEVRAAAQSGRLTTTAAAEIAKQPREKQAPMLAALETTGKPVKVREVRAAATGEKPKPGIRALRRLLEAHDGLASDIDRGVVAALRYVLDGVRDDALRVE